MRFSLLVSLLSTSAAQIVIQTWASTDGTSPDCTPTPTNVIVPYTGEGILTTSCTQLDASTWIQATSDGYATYSAAGCAPATQTWSSQTGPALLSLGSYPLTFGECFRIVGINAAYTIQNVGYETCPSAVWTAVADGSCASGNCPQNIIELICASTTCKAYLEGIATNPVDKPSNYCDTGDPCFPSSASVTLADGQSVSIGDLSPGDSIVAATADGMLTTDQVSVLSTANPGVEAVFHVLITDDGNTLRVTPDHHLPVGAECCSTLQKAKTIDVGDTLWAAHAKATVVKKAVVIEQGLHSPVLVHGGFPVVDGVITAFDRIEVVTLASFFLPIFEGFLKATGIGALWRSFIESTDREAPKDSTKCLERAVQIVSM